MSHERFMKLAIEEAKTAMHPYGCVIVIDGEVVAKAGSGSDNDPTAHAEIKAIRQACAALNSRRLPGSTIYTTCEPCPMCFSAAWWARVDTIVFGMELRDSDELNGPELMISAEDMNQRTENKINLVGGVLRVEALDVFRDRVLGN